MTTIKFEFDTKDAFGHYSVQNEAVARPLAGTPAKILLVSSSELHINALLAFTNAAGQTTKKQPNLGYASGSTTTIENYIRDNHSPHILIVTAGGLITHLAGYNQRGHGKPWISLLGTPPNYDPGPNFLGAVVFDNFDPDPAKWRESANATRYQILLGKGVSKANIYLYCNPNSAMNNGAVATPTEMTHWSNIDGGGTTSPRQSTANNTNVGAFATDFGSLNPSSPAGLIISADPWFAQVRADLVMAANSWIAAGTAAPRYVCYPHPVYNMVATKPTANRSIVYGPTLTEAYTMLGQLAADALNQKTQKPLGYRYVRNYLTYL